MRPLHLFVSAWVLVTLSGWTASGAGTTSATIMVEGSLRDSLPSLSTHPYQLSYVALTATGGSFPFTIFLQNVPGSIIETRWAFAGTPTIEAATVDQRTRALLGTSAYSPFWVNAADLSLGSAMLGNDRATYVGLTPSGQRFDSPTASYYFAPANGILLYAHTADDEKAIILTGMAHVPVLPPANPSPAPTHQYSRPAFDPHLADAEDPTSVRIGISAWQRDLMAQEQSHVNPTNPRCGGSSNQIFGGKPACSSPFSVTGDFSVVRDTIHFPLYAMGEVEFELKNPHGRPYRSFTCSAHYPKTAQLQETEPECAPSGADPTAPRGPGQHSIHGTGRIEFCLNPTSGFTCAWTVEVTLR